MRELVALIPEKRRKFLAFLCENEEPHSLSQISHSLNLSFVTTRKIAYEFASLGFVKIYDIGRAKIVMPTDKLKDLCAKFQDA